MPILSLAEDKPHRTCSLGIGIIWKIITAPGFAAGIAVLLVFPGNSCVGIKAAEVDGFYRTLTTIRI